MKTNEKSTTKGRKEKSCEEKSTTEGSEMLIEIREDKRLECIHKGKEYTKDEEFSGQGRFLLAESPDGKVSSTSYFLDQIIYS